MPRGRSVAFRLCKIGLGVTAVVLIVALAAFALVAARLHQGPIALDWLAPRIKSALESHLRPGYRFDLSEAALETGENGPVMTLTALTLTDPRGQILLSAPKAALAVDPYAVAAGNFVPARLELTGLDMRFAVAADGGVSISAGRAVDWSTPAPSPNEQQPAAAAGEVAAAWQADTGAAGQPRLVAEVERGLKSLLDAVSDPENP